jgi:hypothetical protein
MKSAAIIAALVGSASAFTPAPMVGINMTYVAQHDEREKREDTRAFKKF